MKAKQDKYVTGAVLVSIFGAIVALLLSGGDFEWLTKMLGK